MSHSLTKIWIHGIIGTKNREDLIHSDFESKLYLHLKNYLENELECYVRIINGISNHVHILLLTSPKYSISEIFKRIKGESSHWINQSDYVNQKFAWQTGYGAFSFSESMINKVEEYIKNQKNHHKKVSFADEINDLIKKYGLTEINR